MAWLFHRLNENIKRRKTQLRCKRCKLFYLKKLSECPHCSSIDDYQLASLLEQKRRFKLGLGKGMLMAATVIIVALILLNT